MPTDKPVEELIKKCQSNGKQGYKYGDNGRCYTYPEGDEQARKDAKQKAIAQGVAIRKAQEMEVANEEGNK
jgi:hypothetical protein